MSSSSPRPRAAKEHRAPQYNNHGAINGLRFERACTQADDRDCWLCGELDAWNKVLTLVSLELIEAVPGWLTLRSTPAKQRQYRSEEELYDAAYVFCWLPKVHRCVQAIRLEGANLEIFYRPAYALASALCRSCNIRDLALRGTPNTFICEEELVEGLGGLAVLENFEFACSLINQTIASHLVVLLRRNVKQIASVVIESNRMSNGTANQLLRALHSCHALNQLSLANNPLDPKMYQDSTLKKLDLSGCFRLNADIRTLSEALETNTSLMELSLGRCQTNLVSVLEALKVNNTLQRMDLTRSALDDNEVATLSSVLQRNTGLRHLVLEQCGINDDAAEALAAALRTNCTLETLNLKSNSVSVFAVAAFCEALRNNDSVKMVLFCSVLGSHQDRTNLSFLMDEDNGYGRIQMTWCAVDIPPLSAAVARVSESPTELHLVPIYHLDEESVCALLENLATNTRVLVLTIELGQRCREAIDALYCALPQNQSIRRLGVTAAIDNASDCGMFSLVAKALVLNNTVTDVSMRSEITSLRSIKFIAHLLSKNTSITKLAVNINQAFPIKRLAILSRGLTKNKNVSKFPLPEQSSANCVTRRVLNALRRNACLQNSAIRFVTKQRQDRRAAQAFEELCCSASFLAHVMEAMGQSESRGQIFHATNYFRLVGVVRESVACYPSASVQLGDLNQDCLCSIVKHLKLSDVVQTEP
ncbi:hypothetical protein HPB48_008083 [Haemaphysalis longicornis]|uniref:Uncharacterized protein n=1 Tax=Haemaphysalis longicornis TaxID=44386 RepID=A0A9J6GW11_HAELO|nr:hypothetical protein HPB48_008083 [Haemaphysalis longicornis]